MVLVLVLVLVLALELFNTEGLTATEYRGLSAFDTELDGDGDEDSWIPLTMY